MKKICDVCGEPITDDDWHDYHEDGCPKNFLYYGDDGWTLSGYSCDCDLVAHPECCPHCNPKETEKLA